MREFLNELWPMLPPIWALGFACYMLRRERNRRAAEAFASALSAETHDDVVFDIGMNAVSVSGGGCGNAVSVSGGSGGAGGSATILGGAGGTGVYIP